MRTDELKSYIKDGELSDKLLDIYLDKESTGYQEKRYIAALTAFEDIYGVQEVSIISAPGRTEVGGNHTDHQHGTVLAASINDDAIAVTEKTDSNLVNIKSEGYELITIGLKDISKKEEEEGTTLALIKGVLAGSASRGFKIGGFNAYITSDVLSGSGLSSSAAFETLIGNIISYLYNDGSIDAVTIAIIGQYAENYYFGKPCGLMDQIACSVGSLCHINFGKGGDEPDIEKISLDMNTVGYSLCITDTKGSHADLTPDYAAVPAEMKAVAAFFGKDYLIEVPEEKVMESIPELRDSLGDRAVLRAIHFYEENKRVSEEAEALKNNDFNAFLRTVKASGDSSYKFLQNVYTTKDILHQNVSIALCISEKILSADSSEACGVCRVHGGGFAGTIQAFVRSDRVDTYRTAMDKVFGEGACAVLKIRKYGCIRVI